MSAFQRILVIGATGAQGGSVARHLLRAGSYSVRCLTRRPHSTAAREIADLGGELVEGDLSDPASLRAALRGCDGAFCVTNYWEHFEREFEHGRNFIGGRVRTRDGAPGARQSVVGEEPDRDVRVADVGRQQLHGPYRSSRSRRDLPARRAVLDSPAIPLP